jgi:DNA polymerase (family 10)
MDKRDIARIFEEIGLLLELKGENPFKSKAYSRAARAIEALQDDLPSLVASGRILEVEGIGQAIAGKLAELLGTGRLGYYEELKGTLPSSLLEMLAVPGLSPKRIMAVWTQLGLATVGELEYACLENRLVGLPGFGEKTQEKIRQGILQFKKRQGFHLYADVIGEAERIVALVRQAAGVSRVELVGDLRRRMEIVRSIPILAAADRAQPVLDLLTQLPGLYDLALDGTSIRGQSTVGVPLSVTIMPRVTAHAMLAATGSDAHLSLLAARAAGRRIEWNLDAPDHGELSPQADNESALYAALDLPYIEPELREGLEEIDLAERGRLPVLVEAGDIQGVFHNHTIDSDGSATLYEMVEAAKALGYRYIGISDHSQSAFYANGLKEDRIRDQHASIEAVRKRVDGIAVFKGIEADILVDGSMDYPDDVLAGFDFVIGSVHGRFNLPEEEQTRRLERALANPFVTMLGHPTGRLLLSREGYRVDMRRVLEAAATHGKVVEINAHPHRLDLDWRLCATAKALGVKVSVNPDAHSTEGLANVPFGINVARKGGLEASDVINTLGAEDVLPACSRMSARKLS